MTPAKSNYLRVLKAALPLAAMLVFSSPAIIYASTYYTDRGIKSIDNPLTIEGAANVWSGGRYATANNYMAGGSLTIGNINANFGGGSGWNANTAGLLLETADNTEIAVHDSGTRVASLMYYEGGANKISIGRDMGWGAIAAFQVAGIFNANSSNSLVGYRAGNSLTTSSYNTAVGSEALYTSTGQSNTAVGHTAMRNSTSGNFNTAVGYEALRNNTTGRYNTVLGYRAGQANGAGEFNTALGGNALYNSTGTLNTGAGYAALYENTTGTNNVGLGYYALRDNTTGSYNIGIGRMAGYGAESYNASVKNGSYNTFIGYNTGLSSTVRNRATAIGYKALVDKDDAIVLGATDAYVGIGTTRPADALQVTRNWWDTSATDWGGGIKISGNAPSISFWDTDHTAQNFMLHVNSDSMNFYVRPSAGGWNRMAWFDAAGNFNMGSVTAIDANSGWHRTYGDTGWYNGTYGGGWYMTDSNWVRAYNSKSVWSPSYGQFDLGLASGGLGASSGYGLRARGTTMGGYFDDGNSSSYAYAAYGDYGVMGYGNTTGGYFYDLDNYTNAYIGYGNYSIYGNGWIRGTADNGYSIFIGGDSAGGDVEIGSQSSGVYALAAWNPTNAVRMDIYAGAYHNLSSIRYKQNVVTIDGGLDKVRRLRGVYFDWKAPYAEFKPGRQVGVIAEEVGKVVPEVVTWDEEAPGYANDVTYDDLTALLIEAVKELDAQALKVGADGSAAVSGDLSAEGNAWGSDSGWISCPETGSCSCPDGSYVTSIRDRGAAVLCHKL